MASIITHALTGAALAAVTSAAPGRKAVVVAAACAALPDVDAIGYRLGVPQGSFFGHRGFHHSLPFSAAVAAVATFALFRRERRPVPLFLVLLAAGASHGVLDAMTNGGYGIAFLSPFDTTRYFLPFRPLEVPPIGITPFFSRRGLAVLRSEALWVWLPLLGLVVGSQAFWRVRRR